MMPLRVILHGDWQHADFAAVQSEIRRRWHVVPAETFTADWMLHFQSRSGSLSQQNLEFWFERLPLARHMVVLGSWSEGEMRNASPLQGLPRCCWFEAIARIQFLSEQVPPPRTASATDAAENACLPRSLAAKSTIVVAAKNRTFRESISFALMALGYDCIHFPAIISPKMKSPQGWLLESDDTRDGWCLPTAQALHARWPHVPGLAILNFPRRSEQLHLEKLGATHILGKPFLFADLEHTLSMQIHTSISLSHAL